ncbi:MAG: RMD1 family protein [Betaproteobacteria bacterium]|nr:RMD1 family protein [Betaproteobacteria bacterium]
MDADLLPAQSFRARAILLGARLETRNWPTAETLARAPLAIRISADSVGVLFRYGVAVLFGAAEEPERALRERLAPLIEHAYRDAEIEELDVRIEPRHTEGLHEGALWVQSGSLERLQLIAESLSKSVLLGHYETRLVGDFDRIEPLALQLARDGRIGGGTRDHVKRIGALLLIEQRMVGRAEIGDKPELLWEHPDLEHLNALLEDEFEIRERLAALDRKLELVARTERTLIELISARHSLRVEWYIVALIAVDILLTLYGMWRR